MIEGQIVPVPLALDPPKTRLVERRPKDLGDVDVEAAEVLEHFQWDDDPVSRDALAEELADVALYLLQLASLTGIDLEQAIIEKLKANYQRVWDSAPHEPGDQPDHFPDGNDPNKNPTK